MKAKESREQARQRNERRRIGLLSAGLCRECGKARIATGYGFCQACADRANALATPRKRQRYASKRAAGVCVECDRPAVEGRSMCAAHLERERREERGRYGRMPPERRRAKAAAARARRERRRAAGLCVRCGGRYGKPEPGCVSCAVCLLTGRLDRARRATKRGGR